jgi:hypothetical protein
MSIPKQMLKEWCETYEEAIETLDYLANRSVGTAKEEIKESLEDFFIDNGLMSEDELAALKAKVKGANTSTEKSE